MRVSLRKYNKSYMFAALKQEGTPFSNIYFLVLQNFSFTSDPRKVSLGKEFLKGLCSKACSAEAIDIDI